MKKEWRNFLCVGLTGGIGTGKSTVAKFIKNMGIPVIDADKVTDELMQKGRILYSKIINSFGEKILQENGEINKKLLAEVVFKNPLELKKLNEITHSKIAEEIFKKCGEFAEKGADIVVCEGALLIEAGYQNFFDLIIVVTSREDLQIKRLARTRQFSKQEALSRIKSQMPLWEKEKYGDFVLENNATMEELKEKTENVIKTIRRK